ncbi:hypothetical protein FQA39_LY13749 [Lamprigera yunnana]|nr:hypothetical protein FQA39_LY13749 [Lamprigera yunnana]
MWKRSEMVPFPSIWRKFKGRKEINGVIPTFWVQDIPLDEFDKVTDCMIEKFCRDEPLTRLSEITNDSKSVKDMRIMWNQILCERLGIICYMENPDANGSPIFAGVNCTHLKTRFDKKLQLHGRASCQLFESMDYLTDQNDTFSKLNSDFLLSGLGLYVLPEFRGQGVGLEIIKARDDLCKAVGIPAIVTVFTSHFSQRIAEVAGYKMISEISYDDLKKANPHFKFTEINNGSKATSPMTDTQVTQQKFKKKSITLLSSMSMNTKIVMKCSTKLYANLYALRHMTYPYFDDSNSTLDDLSPQTSSDTGLSSDHTGTCSTDNKTP